MVDLIIKVSAAIAALAGLATLLYTQFWSPAARRKRQALEDGKDAVDSGDVSGITSAFDKLRRRIAPVILLLLIAGCQAKVVLHPIDKEDIIRIKQGEVLDAPKDGYFLSDRYLKDVMEAKVE